MSNNIILPTERKVETTTELRKPSEDARVERANHSLRKIGNVLEQPGFEYVGSFAAHLYRIKDPTKNEITFMLQTPIGDADEVWCDLAWKGLQTRLMSVFGRQAPRKVKR